MVVSIVACHQSVIHDFRAAQWNLHQQHALLVWSLDMIENLLVKMRFARSIMLAASLCSLPC